MSIAARQRIRRPRWCYGVAPRFVIEAQRPDLSCEAQSIRRIQETSQAGHLGLTQVEVNILPPGMRARARFVSSLPAQYAAAISSRALTPAFRAICNASTVARPALASRPTPKRPHEWEPGQFVPLDPEVDLLEAGGLVIEK